MADDSGTTAVNKVLIVDDHPIVCEGLRQLIDQEDDLEVCGIEDDVAGALEAIRRHEPDVVIVDLNLRGDDGLQLIRSAQNRTPQPRMLVLSMHEDGLYVERALRAGAQGYLTKQEASGRVLTALRDILNGEIYLSDRLRRRQEEREAAQPASDPMEDLSNRELQVFRLIGAGFGTRQIAEELHVSIKTVESHRRNIKQKLKLDSAMDLVRQAVRWSEREENTLGSKE